jgi:hypothetical protein
VTAGLFADGHGEMCDGDRLLSVENNRLDYDPEFRGIRVWKEEDGTLVTYN